MLKVRAPSLPVEDVLRRVARGERPFLLDGAHDGDGLGRYSYAGCDPDDGLVWNRGDAGDPFELLEQVQRRWSTGPVDEHWPIAVGYIGYDVAAHVLAKAHGRVLRARDELGLPDVDFARYRAIWRLDRRSGLAEVLAHDGPSAQQLLSRLAGAPVPLHPPNAGPLSPVWSKADYLARAGRVLDYLHAGDAYQVNLAQRLIAPLNDDGALGLYLALRAIAPAPLGVFLRTSSAAILSNTPERLLRVTTAMVGGRLRVLADSRPIKGTRPRGDDADGDARLVTELAHSGKDAAEHLMIVDLVRNDLGRVAELGTVTATGPRALSLPLVNHLVSTVSACVTGSTAALLAAMLPGGSVTGAPKLRAVEIIDELEGVARGVYCGAIGWLGAGRALDLALPIRTAVVRGGELVLPVGGGIVVDSTPEGEWDETLVKARAFSRALASV